jgi:hypothetical protein
MLSATWYPKVKNSKYAFAGFFCVLLLSSCGKEEYSLKYKFTALDIQNLDNTGEMPQPSVSDSIPSVAYGIRLNLHPVEVSKGDMYPDPYDYPPINTNRIDSISITSNAPFDSLHLAGDLLNELFIYFQGTYFNTQKVGSSLYPTNAYMPGDFEDHPLPEYADLLLIQKPDLNDTHIFTVRLFLLDGTILEHSTPETKLY